MDSRRIRGAGGVVLGERGTIALVRRRGGDAAYLFPKGHIEAGETDEEAARREIAEETGLTDLEYLGDLGSFERHAIKADGSYNMEVLKVVRMFLFAAPRNAKLAPTMEIDDAEWVSFRDMASRIGNEKERTWFASVSDRVRESVQRD